MGRLMRGGNGLNFMTKPEIEGYDDAVKPYSVGQQMEGPLGGKAPDWSMGGQVNGLAAPPAAPRKSAWDRPKQSPMAKTVMGGLNAFAAAAFPTQYDQTQQRRAATDQDTSQRVGLILDELQSMPEEQRMGATHLHRALQDIAGVTDPFDPEDLTDGTLGQVRAQMKVPPMQDQRQIVQLGDGGVGRYDKRSGQWEVLNQPYRKPLPPVELDRGKQLVDPETGEVIADGGEERMTPYQIESLKIQRLHAMNNRNRDRDSFRPATAEEVAYAGLPEGTAAQMNVATGKLEIMSRPNPQSGGMPTEAERKFAMYQQSAARAAETMQAMEDAGYNRMEWNAANGSSAVMNALPFVKNVEFDQRAKEYDHAASVLAESWLRARSGGAATKDEIEMYSEQISPKPGDGPDVRKQKAQFRSQMVDDLAIGAGRAGVSAGREPPPGTVRGSGAGQRQRMSIPREAASELRSDPSPEAIQEFEAVFGPGSAAQVLNGAN